MKLNVRYRYVAWDEDGCCASFSKEPFLVSYGYYFWSARGDVSVEPEYQRWLNGETANAQYYDTEDEEDMNLLRVMVSL